MDKQAFYTQLSEKLKELGVGEEYISRHLKQFDGYFAGKSDSEISQEIDKLGSIDRVASRIKRMTDKLIEEESAEAEAKAAAESTVAKPAPPSSDNQEKNDALQQTGEFSSVAKEQKAPKSKPLSEVFSDSSEKQRKEISSQHQQESKQTQKNSSDFASAEAVQYAALDEETIKNNTKKFWLFFALLLPVILALVFAVAFCFAIAFFAIAVIIIISVAVLVGLTAGGTVISVFGLIFGVVQMATNFTIGLYECGLSIMIGSGIMFCGILIYNFAVRLMPFCAKMLLKLAKFVIKKSKELYIYLKKECIGA